MRCALLIALCAPAAYALDATVLHVVDGDTYDIAGELWPGQVLTRERVRLADWDTPEPGGRAGCPREADLAAQATAMVRRMMAEAGMRVYVQHTGKRGSLNRPLVHIWIDGQSLGVALAEAGLARPWERGRAEEWCDE